MKCDYKTDEITHAEQGHDDTFKFKIVVYGSENKSKFLSITRGELEQIKAIFQEPKGDTFRTLKELNRKIKDFSNGNLKAHNYADLINHLIDFKDHAEQNGDEGAN